jgi:hypothetical protein
MPQASSSSIWQVVPSQQPAAQLALVPSQTQIVPSQRCPLAQLPALHAQVPSPWQTCPGDPHG